MKDLKSEIDEVLKYSYFTGKNAPIEAQFYPTDGKFLIITGDNASGKSFVARLISARAQRKHKLESIRVSMELRSTSGMLRAFVYGDEGWESTGMISLKSVKGGINTCKKRDIEHSIIFDEPDVGLSEKYQSAMGELISNFAKDIPQKTKFCIIVTHSRALVKQLLHLKPHFLRIGDKKTIQEFIQEPEVCSIEEIDKLESISLNRFRAISKILNAKK